MPKCKWCKATLDKDVGVVVHLKRFCNFDHAAKFALKASQNAKIKARKQSDRKRKQAIKTKSEWMRESQTAFNAWVRFRDRNKPCISCGETPKEMFGGNTDCGHYLSRGARSHLRFNLFNAHSQCVKCNRYLSGNIANYRVELIKRIGIERVERLENDNEPRSFDIEYLKRVKLIFTKKLRLRKKKQRTLAG